MRRFLALVMAGALAFLAWSAVSADTTTVPEFGSTVPPDPDGAVGKSSVWYCAWVDSGAIRDSSYEVATFVDVEASITLPNPIPNEGPDTLTLSIDGPGARSVDTSSIVRRGEAPGIVEFSNGPATASALVWSEALVTGDRCVVSVPKQWHLTGGTTREGAFSSLRLFNPFPDNAKVTVAAFSEFGSEPLASLALFDVPGRSWRTLDLTQTIPFLDDLAITVSTDPGLVIPSLVLADELGEGSWPGTGLSTVWEFPTAAIQEIPAVVSLANTSGGEVDVAIDIVTSEGTIIDAAQITVPAGIPVRVLLDDLAVAPFAAIVNASAPIAASVQASALFAEPSEELGTGEDEPPPEDAAGTAGEEGAEEPVEEVVIDGVAGTIGLPTAALRWLVPGVGSAPDTVGTLWILNSGGDVSTITITPLGAEAPAPEKLRVEPGTVGSFTPPWEPGIVPGYLVDASEPVTVAWSGSGPRGVVMVAGVPAE